MFGGGGMNPRKMKQMMEQMGIDLDELDAEEVIIRTADEELVFTDAQVTRMDAQGQQTYQVVGSPESRPLDGGDTAGDAGAVESGDEDDSGITDDDVRTVAEQAGASKDAAREALEAEDGDLAAAIMRLS